MGHVKRELQEPAHCDIDGLLKPHRVPSSQTVGSKIVRNTRLKRNVVLCAKGH